MFQLSSKVLFWQARFSLELLDKEGELSDVRVRYLTVTDSF